MLTGEDEYRQLVYHEAGEVGEHRHGGDTRRVTFGDSLRLYRGTEATGERQDAGKLQPTDNAVREVSTIR